MPNQKLIAVLSLFLMMNTASRLLAAYTVDQLKEIEQLVMGKDSGALGAYLAAHPEVTRGNDPLAVELRKFLDCTRTSGLDCFHALPKRHGDSGSNRQQKGIY